MPNPEPPPVDINSVNASRGRFAWDIRISPHEAAWVRLHGELDIADAAQIKHTLTETLGKTRLLVLDLRELSFIDSAGGHVIDHLADCARQSQRRVVLVRGPAHVHRVLTLGGFAERLEIIDLSPAVASAAAVYRDQGRVRDRMRDE